MPEIKVASDMDARVWKIEVAVGDMVAEGGTLLILESMKTELPIDAPRAGRVAQILVVETDTVTDGQVLVVLEG